MLSMSPYAIPEALRETIANHIRDSIKDAEYGFQYANGDEDAVTGALGQALLSRPHLQNIRNGKWRWRITWKKIRGRGKGAPEKVLGADGIFQLSIFDEVNEEVFRKGLLFQAKVDWRRTDNNLLLQTELMCKYPKSSIVINYTHEDYSATPAEVVYQSSTNITAVPNKDIRPLAEILSEDFLICIIGREGLYYDKNNERLLFDRDYEAVTDFHIIETIIERMSE